MNWRIRAFLRRVAHPTFECEDCIGMADRGCYCAYNNASAPGIGAGRIQRLALWLLDEK